MLFNMIAVNTAAAQDDSAIQLADGFTATIMADRVGIAAISPLPQTAMCMSPCTLEPTA